MSLEKILVDPSTKKALQIDWDKRQFSDLNTELFEGRVQDGIPIILPKKVDTKLQTTDQHLKLNSSFNYLEHYTNDAEVFDYEDVGDAMVIDERNRLNQQILKKIDPQAKVILDVGCGNGWLAKAVQTDHNFVISMDVSLVNTKKALKNQPHKNHKALVADVFHLPIAENSLDVVVASEIIEHVSDPKLFIAKLLRALKPGGKLIISTPYDEVIQHSLCIHCNLPTPAHAHLHSFTEKSMKTIIPTNIKGVVMSKSVNKCFLKTRLSKSMRSLPFGIWKTVDNLTNTLFQKPTRLIVEIKK